MRAKSIRKENIQKHVSKCNYWEYFFHAEGYEKILSQNILSQNEKVDLFNRFVYVINLELSTYCNRKCTYCPLSIYQRSQKFMPNELFKRIVFQLEKINYKGMIMTNLYNEPLLDNDLSNKIKFIREHLSESWIIFNSNGDFLTKDLWDILTHAGLNQIIVTLHTLPGKEYVDNDKEKDISRFLKKMGLVEWVKDNRIQKIFSPGKNITLDIPFSEKKRLLIKCDNWSMYGNDRGGVLEKLSVEQRTRPCVNPFREIFIAYDGTIKSCCNIYFNADNVYGNVYDKDMIDIYFSKELCDFRRKLFDFSLKWGGCKTCNTPDNAKKSTEKLRKQILNLYK